MYDIEIILSIILLLFIILVLLYLMYKDNCCCKQREKFENDIEVFSCPEICKMCNDTYYYNERRITPKNDYDLHCEVLIGEQECSCANASDATVEEIYNLETDNLEKTMCQDALNKLNEKELEKNELNNFINALNTELIEHRINYDNMKSKKKLIEKDIIIKNDHLSNIENDMIIKNEQLSDIHESKEIKENEQINLKKEILELKTYC